MRQRPVFNGNTAVSSVPSHDAAQPKKIAATGMKKRLKGSGSSFSMSIWGIVILLIGVVVLLLLRSAAIKGSDSDIATQSEEEKVAVFLNWFREEGGNVSSSITVKTFPGMGRGVVALQSVEENEELLFVPKRIVICRDTIAQEWKSEPKLLKKMAKLENDQEELLTAFLLMEQAKEGKSRWTPYLELLPAFSSRNEVASPLLFTSDSAVEALQDERMITEAKSERQRAKKAHSRFKRLFRNFVNDNELQLSRYVWARFLVNSRAFSIRGQRVLVPFGDTFNGEPHHETRQHDNGQRFLDFHHLQTEGMTIRADRSTPIGVQLFEDYGDNSNYIYFLYHGFLMDDRGFDCAAFRLPSILEAQKPGEETEELAEFLAAKAQALSRIRIDDAPLACISRAGKMESAELLRIYTILYNMDAGQSAACNEARSFSECFPPELMSATDAQSRLEEINLVLSGVQRQIEQYQTTTDEDHLVLEQNSSIKVNDERHAVAFRLSRKHILRSVQAILKEQVLQLRNIELQGKHIPVDELEVIAEDTSDDKLSRFERWIARHNFPVNNLELRYISKAMGFGTFAVKPLSSGDTYLSVPVQAVMDVNSALKSVWVRQTMRELQEQHLKASREEMLLLLHVLEEKFGSNHLQSHWKPYLDMLPSLDDEDAILGSPLFYEENEEQLKALEGTDLLTLITNYRERVRESYRALSQQLKRSGHHETLAWLTEIRFRWANGVLDSRSIWWNGQRHLVPLLDMVNCQELDPKHEPHHTNLDSSGRQAVTQASWEFDAGQEVVENYAQPNYIYLLYHGFVVDSNSYDCAHFHLEVPTSSFRQRELVALARELEIFSWTPDVCVSPSDEKAIVRFAKIALLASDPGNAIKQLKDKTVTSAEPAPPQAISSALKLVTTRLQRLEASAMGTSNSEDFRTQAINKYRQQQLQHLSSLHSILQAQTTQG